MNTKASETGIPGKRTLIFLICCLAVLASAFVLLRGDATSFLVWWFFVLILGILFFPLSSRLFRSFSDKGWGFSKVLGIAASGYVMFVFCRAGIMPFTALFSLLCTVISAAAVLIPCIILSKKQGRPFLEKKGLSFDLILFEEFLFLAVFLMWTYFTGFRPEALSTEKFMD